MTRSAAVSFALAALAATVLAAAEPAATWDFREEPLGWIGNPQVADMEVTAEGLAFRCAGVDPWLEGPAVDLPEGGNARVTLRMKSSGDRSAEVFYGREFVAGRSTKFAVDNDGQFHDYEIVLCDVGPDTRLRLDPCGAEGDITLAWLRVEPLPKIEPPELRGPSAGWPDEPVAREARYSSRFGDVVVRHRGDRWGAFSIWVDGQRVAVGNDNDVLGVMEGDEIFWLPLREGRFSSSRALDADFSEQCEVVTPSGGRWILDRTFGWARGRRPEIGVRTFIKREGNTAGKLVHVPWLTLFAGYETWGSRKHQALLPGLEYLADEPSSSTLDVRGPAHDRRVPDPVKLTARLAAIEHDGRYLAVTWDEDADAAVVFDSPDRTFGTDAHLIGLWGPGVGGKRLEGELFASSPLILKAQDELHATASIFAGRASSVAPVVQRFCVPDPLPAVPGLSKTLEDWVALLAAGWLDSAAHEDGLWRHAVWGEHFGAHTAADAPVFMLWLAEHTSDRVLAERLLTGVGRGLEVLAERDPNYVSGVSHVRGAVPAMVLGRLAESMRNRKTGALQDLERHFGPDGICRYRPAAGKTDYGEGHFADHANGLAFARLKPILETAALSGDGELMERSLALLDRQTELYRNTVPRGAQTWEVPLHTPDILASAHAIDCYVTAYELTGRTEYRDEAVYWAWTGVPFVYLRNPTAGEVGPYATIAVYGATSRQAPVWFGLPVQWCGLVYASSIHRLAPYDPDAPWGRIARGITATGLQMTFPLDDEERRGLLPDFYHLRGQFGDGPAINPGTVQATVPELFGLPSLLSFRRIPEAGWFLSAPCGVEDLGVADGVVRFRLVGWQDQDYSILLSRVAEAPASVDVRARESAGAGEIQDAAFEYHQDEGWLIIPVSGEAEIRIAFR